MNLASVYKYGIGLILGFGIGIGIMALAKQKPTESTKSSIPCPSYQEFYDQDCVFCKIIAGQEPAIILYEDEVVIAFEKKPVRTPANCLIVPKKHIENFKEFNTHDACNLDIL